MSAGRALARRISHRVAPLLAAATLLLILSAPMIRAPWAGLGPARAFAATDTTETAIPDYVGYLNDRAGVIDEPTRAKLEAFLDQLQKKTGAQFAILTIPSTAPETPSEFKVRVFQKWGIGKKGEDNGLLMLVAVSERQVRFETGYGLEGVLPDVLETRIFREQMAPRFRTGDMSGGIVAGTLECARRIAADKNVTLEWDGRELRYDAARRATEIPLAVVLLIFIAIAVMVSIINRGGRGPGGGSRGGWGPFIGGALGGGFGGGGFGGGGFGGGGGGGGGSFGGFGGGASGGGGGGGGW